MKNRKRLGAWLVILAMLLAMFPTAAYAADSTAYTDLSGVTWNYTADNPAALTSIQDGNQTIENASVLMISDSAAGVPVTGIESNGFDNVVVGHTANTYILIASGIESISAKAFYDFNYVKGVSIPASVTDIDPNAFDVLGREINNSTVIYGASGSAAESWAASNSTAVYTFEPYTTENFTASADEGGSIYPSGSWYVPDDMKAAGTAACFSIEAADGNVIDTLTVDSEPVPEAAGKAQYLLDYTFTADSAAISVTFTAGEAAEEAGSAGEETVLTFDPVTVTEGGSASVSFTDGIDGLSDLRIPNEAVADGIDLSDAYDLASDNAGGYAASMGVSTGDYYLEDGILYQMVFGTNGTGENGDCGEVFLCKAQVINYLYREKGWVYGTDYDLIRMYHYDATVSSGNRKGTYDFHCAFVYQLVDDSGEYDDLTGTEAFYSESEAAPGITNNSTLFVQGTAGGTASAILANLKANCFTRPDGPQEATNFYGLGSAVVVNGGTPSQDETYATTIYNEDEVNSVELINPDIDGGANPLYVLATGLAKLQGGRLFTAYSGGHGPYASLQGQIVINAGEDIVDEDGEINTDVDDLTENVLADRPGRFGWAERNTYEDGTEVPADDYGTVHSKLATDDDAIEAYEEKNGDVTVVTTANSSGSLLVTDSGGGIIVANKVSGTAYSTGSSGIYAMGGGSYVYVYNSRLESHIEPAINSVGEGYVFGYNSEFVGPIGILSSGGDDHVQIYNSRIETEADFEMDFYDLTDPNDAEQLAAYQTLTENVDADELVNSNFLMIFPLNGDDMSNFTDNWFTDKTQVPGKNGGNIALISTTSASGITIDSTNLTNNAYAENAALGVPNWLVAAAGGTSVINFNHENSRTKWDLTGAEDTTTELSGNLYCAASSGEGMWVTAAGSMIVNLSDSEWTGTIENCGEGVTLNLDADSSWTVTGTCTVKELTLAEGAEVTAPDGYALTATVNGQAVTLKAGTYQNVHMVLTKNGETVYDGTYTEQNSAASDTTAAAEASDAGQGGQGGGEGGQGGGEGGQGGGEGEATSNCTHAALDGIVDVTVTAADDSLVTIEPDGNNISVSGTAVGSTTLTVTLTTMSGETITGTADVTVEAAPAEEPSVQEATAAKTPAASAAPAAEEASEETQEKSGSKAPLIAGGAAVLIAAAAAAVVGVKKKKK